MQIASIWHELMSIPFKQYYANANGIRTRVLEAGDEAGEPLLLLHGTGGHIEAFARNIRELSKHFRVICFDMVGHGYSAKPDRPYTIDYYSDHLLALLDELNLSKVNISGESLGAWVSAWFAAHHPEYVKSLILVTPGNVTNKPEVMKSLKESTVKAVVEANYENVRKRLEWLFYNKSFVTDELVETRYQIYSQEAFKKAVYNIVVLQDLDIRKQYIWSPEWCNKISAPTLLFWTGKDPSSSVEEAQLLKEMIPDSQLVVVKDAGHWPQWETPEEFNSIHYKFILEGSI